ncbi:DUF397 domain-containing protein [Streptomyces griseocarneus]|nr:DUF397 domain-containing protein [Streptomyces griseocarneus]
MHITKPDWSIASWRKSAHSQNASSCIEIAEQYPTILPVRDSKTPSRTPVIVPRASWTNFVGTVTALH